MGALGIIVGETRIGAYPFAFLSGLVWPQIVEYSNDVRIYCIRVEKTCIGCREISDMLTLIWTVIVLFGLAVVVDQLLTEEDVKRWRESTRRASARMDELGLDAAITNTHGMFCNLFDAIYGDRYWSRKRVVRSYYCSLLALGTVTLLLGWESTMFGRLVNDVGTEKFYRMVYGDVHCSIRRIHVSTTFRCRRPAGYWGVTRTIPRRC